MLDDKIILITGGTGTIGELLLKRILDKYSSQIIRIYSRDETKQHKLKMKFNREKDRIRFLIGDIRDKERLNRALQNVDIVFHLAALKHVVSCEYNPFEAIKTNILGLQNLIECCIDNNVEKLIFTSTDKAATPCNIMGVTKLLGEKLITAANYYKGKAKTIFYSVRLGNVLGSRGSLIPIIKNQIINDFNVTLTHTEMTRYIITIESSLKLLLDTLDLAQGGEVFILKMKAIRIVDLIEILIEYFVEKFNKNPKEIKIEEIGMFAGEKLYEELFSIEESDRTYETDDMYIIFPQLKEVFQKIDLKIYSNIKKFEKNAPFNSNNGPFLSKEELKVFLIEHKII